MDWLHCVSYFFGGTFLVNAVPHLINGISGRPFQSPFAKPPGKGLSSATVNVLWSFFNLAVAYGLLLRVGAFDLRDNADIIPAALGGLMMAVTAAHLFGPLHGGDLKGKTP